MSRPDPTPTQSVARSFWHLRSKGVTDPDVDMFLAVIAALGTEKLAAALAAGANPNVTDTKVTTQYERFLADLESPTWARWWGNTKAATPRRLREFVLANQFAYSPLVGFLVVAALGIWVGPKDYLGLLLWEVLVVVPIGTVLVAWRRRARFGEWALVGGGASLSFFTAAYLVSAWLDDQSILRTGPVPIEQIGEAAFLSLTIGVTGGTIDIDLNGLARVIAFIQIIFSLGLAGIVVSRLWGVIARSSSPTPRE